MVTDHFEFNYYFFLPFHQYASRGFSLIFPFVITLLFCHSNHYFHRYIRTQVLWKPLFMNYIFNDQVTASIGKLYHHLWFIDERSFIYNADS